MKDFLILAIIILAIAWLAIAAGYIWKRGPTVRNFLIAPFISAGVLVAIILPFIGGALLALLQYAKRYK